MITKNFKNWAQAISTMYGDLHSANFDINLPYFKSTSGNMYNNIHIQAGTNYANMGVQPLVFCPDNTLTYSSAQYYQGNSRTSLWVGTSTANETEDDFEITPITSGLSSTAFTMNRTISDGKVTLQFARTLKNTSDAPITINEVALLHTCPPQYYHTVAMYLFDRRVLPEPITLEPNEEHTFSMVYEF